MASAADGRRRGELRRGCVFGALRLVATRAGHPFMAAIETEFRLRMIEVAELLPIHRLMTGFAGDFCLVWILVAATAGQVRETILAASAGRLDLRKDWLGSDQSGSPAQWFVAGGALHRGVLACEREASARVARHSKRRRPEAFLRMARVAAVVQWSGREFSGVRIGVALGANQ